MQVLLQQVFLPILLVLQISDRMNNFSIKKSFVLLIFIISLFSCEKKVQIPSNKIDNKDSISADMIKLNQLLIEVEQKQIQAYIDSNSFDFDNNEGGFQITWTHKGLGEKINKNDLVEVAYQVETIQGDTCYTYTGKLKQEFVVGKLEKQRGFNEALTLLTEGDQTIIIVPSHLAYGAMGDLNNISPRTTLLYKVFSIKKLK